MSQVTHKWPEPGWYNISNYGERLVREDGNAYAINGDGTFTVAAREAARCYDGATKTPIFGHGMEKLRSELEQVKAELEKLRKELDEMPVTLEWLQSQGWMRTGATAGAKVYDHPSIEHVEWLPRGRVSVIYSEPATTRGELLKLLKAKTIPFISSPF